MTKQLGLSGLLFATVLLGAPEAQAGGFLLNDHGAKATGRVDAVSATVTDGSAIFYNPGGVGAAEGTHVYVGASMIVPSASFTQAGTTNTIDSETATAFTPSAYFHAQTHEIVRVGLGFYTPFGSALKWGAESPGRDIVREISLRTFYISPVVGLDLGKWLPGLTIGGGIDFVPATVSIKRDLIFGDDIGTAELGGNGFGVGGRIGLQYRPEPVPGLAVGLSYRSSVKIDFDGEGDFDLEGPARAALPPDGDITSAVTLPSFFQGGVAYSVSGFELEADLQWVGWDSVESLDIVLPDGSVTVDRRNYESVFTLRFGAEYTLANIGLSLRGGYAYDPTPIPRETLTVSLPDIDRHVVSGGLSYQLPKGFVDVGALFVLPGERDAATDDPYAPQLKGTYEISAIVLALSYGITFGGESEATTVNEEIASK